MEEALDLSFDRLLMMMIVLGEEYVLPCHHGMACPQGAEGGTASSMEGSCEYIE